MEELFYDMLEKARMYCLRGEKCLNDVSKKLWQWQIPQAYHNKILNALLDDGFVDEQRYTDSFLHDKLWLSKWGRVKIRYHLKSKNISDTYIEKSFQSIDNDRYFQLLSELAESRWEQICKKEPDFWKAKQKLTYFLAQRGFEIEEINRLTFFEK